MEAFETRLAFILSALTVGKDATMIHIPMTKAGHWLTYYRYRHIRGTVNNELYIAY